MRVADRAHRSWHRFGSKGNGEIGETSYGFARILREQFLAEVCGLKHQNVAAELLEKLLKDEIKVRSKRNFVQIQFLSNFCPRS